MGPHRQFVCLFVCEVYMSDEYPSSPEGIYLHSVSKYLHDKEFSGAQFRVMRAVDTAKRILIMHKVQHFTAADVVATAALILEEEKKQPRIAR